jgi:integrase
MDSVRLPRNAALSSDGGYWILCWQEALIESQNHGAQCRRNVTRIGSAIGPEALTEIEATRQARRYLLSRLPPSVQARRSQMTIEEFIAKRFLPEFIAGKTFAWRAHYLSILKHILSPDVVDRLLGNHGDHASAKHQPHSGWPYLNHIRLRDVCSSHVHELISAALAKGYSPQTVRHIRSVLSAVFSYARQELIFTGTNPVHSADVPEIDRKSTAVLSLEQIERALEAMQYPERQMTTIALLTDMNVSEICGLQWKHVNLTGAGLEQGGKLIPPFTVSVNKRLYRGELANVKDARQRIIPIPGTLIPMLLVLRARTRFNGPDDFVLTSRSGTAVNVSNITARRLGHIGKELGIPELTLQALHRAQALIKEGLGAQFQHRIGIASVSNLQPVDRRTAPVTQSLSAV